MDKMDQNVPGDFGLLIGVRDMINVYLYTCTLFLLIQLEFSMNSGINSV